MEQRLDTLSPQERSKRMGRVRNKNTKPEMIVRRLVHGLGYRYRLHSHKLPGRPDIVFAGRKKVIFIHGCFWHRHDEQRCPLTRWPKSRLEFWVPKSTTSLGETQLDLSSPHLQAVLAPSSNRIVLDWKRAQAPLSQKTQLRFFYFL